MNTKKPIKKRPTEDSTVADTLSVQPPNAVLQSYMVPAVVADETEESWKGANLETLSQWIQISSLQIEILDLSIKHYRNIIRNNVVLGLVFSTTSGSISVTQLNHTTPQFILNIIFIVMSFSIAIFTGIIKIYQVQERLEDFIQCKQEWISFSVVVTTEVQLPVKQRKNAQRLIYDNKSKYLDLLKRDYDIPTFIKKYAYKNLYNDKKHYLENEKVYKKLKELDSCTDDAYFYKSAKSFMETNASIIEMEQQIKSQYHQVQYMFESLYDYLRNWFRPHKSKYDLSDKTSLSNIFLTVIMEEENEQRTQKIIELQNIVRERKAAIESRRLARADSVMSEV
jgi:hypothetical protein